MIRITIVTGASGNHFACLGNLLDSIEVNESDTRTIVYDLGLDAVQVRELAGGRWEIRKFAFDDYPAYCRIDDSQRYTGFHIDKGRHSGCYAWKPIIISDILEEVGGAVLWLDAGNLVHRPLAGIRSTLAAQGIYAPVSQGTIQRWMHPKTLAYLEVPPGHLVNTNRNAAVLGFAPGRPGILELVREWRRCALDESCIAPTGADHSNHRWDQALLSALVYQFQERYGYELADDLLDVSIHNDRLSREEARMAVRLEADVLHRIAKGKTSRFR
jgi:hypothetical protein